ncbi:hypothetical protein GOODEAATRI_009990 [Goodea atripinnis]|uniref:Uncharacterized protein n=1 Tax=Goodea atripinnis TaxID=208336 RepID=A0ABV0PM98_9TELE
MQPVLSHGEQQDPAIMHGSVRASIVNQAKALVMHFMAILHLQRSPSAHQHPRLLNQTRTVQPQSTVRTCSHLFNVTSYPLFPMTQRKSASQCHVTLEAAEQSTIGWSTYHQLQSNKEAEKRLPTPRIESHKVDSGYKVTGRMVSSLRSAEHH